MRAEISGMDATQKREFGDARRHLRRADQGAGGDSLKRRDAREFEQLRQMRRHGAGDEPTRRKYEREQQHFAVRPPTDLLG